MTREKVLKKYCAAYRMNHDKSRSADIHTLARFEQIRSGFCFVLNCLCMKMTNNAVNRKNVAVSPLVLDFYSRACELCREIFIGVGSA